MKFYVEQNQIDPEVIELYQQWKGKRLWVCNIHTDFAEDEWLQALEEGEEVIVEVKMI